MKNKATIRAVGRQCSIVERKRVGKDEEITNAFITWFKFARGKNGPVNGLILTHKANEIAQAAGHDNFKPLLVGFIVERTDTM